MSRWMLGVTACLGLTGLAACASPSQPVYTPGVAAIRSQARDAYVARQLWARSEQLTGVRYG